MPEDIRRLLTRWTSAGVIDGDTAARIQAFEERRGRTSVFRWPIAIALTFGAVMLAAGVLLFVSAHWDSLSPPIRFTLALLLVAVFHGAAAAVADRFPALAGTLHLVGSMALGAGIFLTAQIFNLDEHWPSGLLLWAAGAAIAWWILADWTQLGLVAILAPAWLCAEWWVANNPANYGATDLARVAVSGVFLLSVAYFTMIHGQRRDGRGRMFLWVGGLAFAPAALALVAISADIAGSGAPEAQALPASMRAAGWSVALGIPLLVAGGTRRAAAWPFALAVAWVLVLINLRSWIGTTALYPWWVLGATGIAAWGVRDGRGERVNMGAAIFAATVLTFYFSQVMDRLGRSASLIGFGVIFIAGGWMLERVRRRLVLQTKDAPA